MHTNALPATVDCPVLMDTHCESPRRFINRLSGSSHTYTHSERKTDRQAERKTERFVLQLSGNKRRMGAVTSESGRLKETEIEGEKEGNKRDEQQRERHSVIERWGENKRD